MAIRLQNAPTTQAFDKPKLDDHRQAEVRCMSMGELRLLPKGAD